MLTKKINTKHVSILLEIKNNPEIFKTMTLLDIKAENEALNPVRSFIELQIEVDQKGFVSSQELFAAFKYFVEKSGQDVNYKINTFNDLLYQQFIELQIPAVKSRRNTARGFRGIKLNPEKPSQELVEIEDFGAQTEDLPLPSLLTDEPNFDQVNGEPSF